MSDGRKRDKLTKTVGQLAEQFTVFGTTSSSGSRPSRYGPASFLQ